MRRMHGSRPIRVRPGALSKESQELRKKLQLSAGLSQTGLVVDSRAHLSCGAMASTVFFGRIGGQLCLHLVFVA